MSEKLNNSIENPLESSTNQTNTLSEMRGKFEPNEAEMAKYEAMHPEAVKDIEKARTMAEAGNDMRTMAAEDRRNAKEWQEKADNHGDSFAGELAKFDKADAALSDAIAEQEEKMAGELYDVEKLYEKLVKEEEGKKGEEMGNQAQ